MASRFRRGTHEQRMGFSSGLRDAGRPPVPALRCRHRGPDPSWRAPSALSRRRSRLRATPCPTGSDGTHHRLSSLAAPAPRPRTRVEAENAATTATPVTSARRVIPAPNHDDPQRLSPTPPEPQLAQLVHISRRGGALAHPPAPATGASRLRRAPALALPGLPAATAIRLGSGAENSGALPSLVAVSAVGQPLHRDVGILQLHPGRSSEGQRPSLRFPPRPQVDGAPGCPLLAGCRAARPLPMIRSRVTAGFKIH